MARLARVVIPGLPHHVTQRGTRRQDVFFTDEDRLRYLEFVREAARRFGVTIWSWCLMTNHVHFVAVPDAEKSLTLCFGKAHTQYTRMINFRKRWRGFLWQGRFASSPMDGAFAYRAVRYVERNPVRADLVRLPWRYEWSSAAFHAGERKTDPLVERVAELDEMVGDWREYLISPDGDEVLSRVRRETAVGRPLGSPEFVRRIEEDLDLTLTRRPPGRPGKRNH